MPMSNQIHSGPVVADNEEEEQSLDHADIKSGTFEIPQKDDPPPTEEPKLAKPPSHRSERSNTGKKKIIEKNIQTPCLHHRAFPILDEA